MFIGILVIVTRLLLTPCEYQSVGEQYFVLSDNVVIMIDVSVVPVKTSVFFILGRLSKIMLIKKIFLVMISAINCYKNDRL